MIHKMDKAMMQTAQVFSLESYCKRNQVGAVLVKEGRIIANGYNGTIKGHENDCEDGNVTKTTVLHAEQNVIAFAAKHGVSTNGTIMYTTVSPCDQCAKLIIQSGISEIVYLKEYRLTEGINLLRESGVTVRQML